ncbi:unnamed protein product [Adineta steineri]|uniref:DUF3533 domain-containing protein n=2 Tax=Adineta steineri TaxID=433720 RepID=A0A818WPH7_9BILA|nr:unnamed protein product [Adineta steineri]
MTLPPRLSYAIVEDPSSYLTPVAEPVHLWNSSNKEIVTLRKSFFKQWFFASIELWILIFLIATIYLGSGQNPSRYTGNLDVTIVNYDGDIAGNYFLNAFRQSAPGNQTLNWHYKDSSDYNNNVDETKYDVEHGKSWAVVVLRQRTTRRINETVFTLINTSRTLISPFTIVSPIVVFYADGRNSFTVNNYVLPPIRSAIAIASAKYGQMLRSTLLQNLSSSSDSSSNRSVQLLNTFRIGSLLINPLTAQYQNLHPGSPFVGQLATTLGYIYIYLISAMVVGGTLKFLSQYVTKVHWIDVIVFRILNGFFQGFIISLIYSLIVLWLFGIHSGSLFMRYWMFNWLSSMVFGIIIVLFTTNLGILGNSILTVFVILMLAGSTLQLALELSHPFYRYGYGLPLYHIINGGRHLLFNSYSNFRLNVGVLLAYFSTLWLLAFGTGIFWIKRQQKKAARQSQLVKTEKQ